MNRIVVISAPDGATLTSLPFMAANYASIQAAIDAASSNATAKTPRSVYIAAGTWTETIKLKSYVHVYGDGMATVLKAPNASTTASAVVALYDGSQERCEFSDCTVDGNSSNQPTTVHGVSIANTQGGAAFPSGRKTPAHKVHDLYITQCKGNGLDWSGDVFSGDNFIWNIQTYFVDNHGVYLSAADNNLSNLNIGQSGVNGLHITGGNNRFTNVKSWFSGRITSTGAGVYIDGKRNQFAAVESQDSKGHGYIFTTNAQGNVLAGAVADSNGFAQNSAGFYFDNLSTNNFVTGAAMDRAPSDRAAGGLAQAWALQIVTGAFRNTININCGVAAVAPINGTVGDNDVQVKVSSGTASTSISRSSILPSATSALDLGSVNFRWNLAYAVTFTGFHTYLNAGAGTVRDLTFQTSGAKRWSVQANATAENSGTNGSDFEIVAYDQAGTSVLSTPISIKRSTGVVTMPLHNVGAYATGSRPSAASIGAGGHVFDSTLNKPIWSDGTNWRDATGTIV